MYKKETEANKKTWVLGKKWITHLDEMSEAQKI